MAVGTPTYVPRGQGGIISRFPTATRPLVFPANTNRPPLLSPQIAADLLSRNRRAQLQFMKLFGLRGMILQQGVNIINNVYAGGPAVPGPGPTVRLNETATQFNTYGARIRQEPPYSPQWEEGGIVGLSPTQQVTLFKNITAWQYVFNRWVPQANPFVQNRFWWGWNLAPGGIVSSPQPQVSPQLWPEPFYWSRPEYVAPWTRPLLQVRDFSINPRPAPAAGASGKPREYAGGKKKHKWSLQGVHWVGRAIAYAVSHITEFMDFLMVLAEASGFKFNPMKPQKWWQQVAEHLLQVIQGNRALDWTAFIRGLAIEGMEDRFWATVGRGRGLSTIVDSPDDFNIF